MALSPTDMVNKLPSGDKDPNISDTFDFVNPSKLSFYEFMDDTFHGTAGYEDGSFLVPHNREMFYEQRRALAFYKNFIRPIVRSMVEPVFVKPAPRKVDPSSEKFEAFIKDADNAKTSLQSFSEDSITTARLHGAVFTVVDNFTDEELPPTDAEAVAQRKFPYVSSFTQDQVKDYEIDKFGNLVWIMFFEEIRIINRKEVKVFRKWTTTTTELVIENPRFDKSKPGNAKKFKVLEERTHGLNQIPVITTYMVRRRRKKFLLVKPPLYDMARINLALFNKDSEVRDLERSQGFSVLYVFSEGGRNITISAHNVIKVPVGGSAPGYISPDTGILANLMDSVKNLTEDLFRIAEQNGVTGVKDESGIAKQWDFFAHESILQKTSDGATALEMAIADLFMAYTKETFVYTVDYPDSFQPGDKEGKLKQIGIYLDLDVPSKGQALAKEKATRTLFADEDEARVEEVVDQIKAEADNEAQSNAGGGGEGGGEGE